MSLFASEAAGSSKCWNALSSQTNHLIVWVRSGLFIFSKLVQGIYIPQL